MTVKGTILAFGLCAGFGMGATALWAQTGLPREIPDPALSPGKAASTDQAEVCARSGGKTYSKQHRKTPVSLKVWIMKEYGQPPGHAGDGEIDHILPLCLGGADEAANLWWQPGNGHGTVWTYHLKDKLEAYACREVCGGKVPLATAQGWFMPDWRIEYTAVFGAPD